ncbi:MULTISPECIES: hypothetical protein [Enterococcus]|uniref:hypothetical protein n=1 Tax=Enterococcus TaxID=1350 RepID=UPI001788A78F|nr:hypothetical protein [Enterococcus avium]HBI1562065.1 hypothetical protein [Enterococcus faecalis]HBI1565124.1 hypothetical protein [Enterococcus faecalis]HBI1717436.1 hypothetical protein [Enterococcus faecalis]HBI1719683.1 hypothetical protein [Enterococcus faecalis]HBI1722801.1 hypothetical protein [Enterococcus faecalis]
MKIRKTIQSKVSAKKSLAALHKPPLYRARQIQAIFYASLLLNLMAPASLLTLWLVRR